MIDFLPFNAIASSETELTACAHVIAVKLAGAYEFISQSDEYVTDN